MKYIDTGRLILKNEYDTRALGMRIADALECLLRKQKQLTEEIEKEGDSCTEKDFSDMKDSLKEVTAEIEKLTDELSRCGSDTKGLSQ